MKNIIRFPETRRIDEEAAQWLVRLDGDGLVSEERAALTEWLQRDARHGAALRRLGQVWGQLDCLAALAPMFPLDDSAAEKVAEPPPGRRQMMLVAASVLVGIAVTLMVSNPVWNPFSGEPDEMLYETAMGQRTDVVLADGSVLTLNTDSRVGVRFDRYRRFVYLQRGEALFRVAKNPQVPFVVRAGNGSVRAIGTAFAVRLREGQEVDVTVSEGVVQVAASSYSDRKAKADSLQTVTLRKGGNARYRQVIDAVQELSPQQLDARLGWRAGKWIFDGETLADAVAEVNRYSHRRIEIVDPGIAAKRIGGYFEIGDIEPLLAALEQSFDIHVARVGTDRVELSRRNP